MIVGNILYRMSSKGLWWSDILAKTWKKWGMNETIISGKECAVEEATSMQTTENIFGFLRRGISMPQHIEQQWNDRRDKCRLYVGVDHSKDLLWVNWKVIGGLWDRMNTIHLTVKRTVTALWKNKL